MTCKDCVYETVCEEWSWQENQKACSYGDFFKNKADFVKVVRCKDCKHYCLGDYRKPNEPKWCDLSRNQNEYPKPNDFCSYGERKEK